MKSICLLMALAAITFGQTLVPEIPYIEPPWLQVNAIQHKRADLKPESVNIITSAKPTVKQIDFNHWQITFSSRF